jgi:hypothetical protein
MPSDPDQATSAAQSAGLRQPPGPWCGFPFVPSPLKSATHGWDGQNGGAIGPLAAQSVITVVFKIDN